MPEPTDTAEYVRTDSALMRSRIRDFMANGYHLTADEIAKQMGLNVLSVRPRVTELVKAGDLVKTRQRRKNQSGTTATVLRHHLRVAEVPLPKPEAPKPRRAATHRDQTGLFA
jgi:hypothetical protein